MSSYSELKSDIKGAAVGVVIALVIGLVYQIAFLLIVGTIVLTLILISRLIWGKDKQRDENIKGWTIAVITIAAMLYVCYGFYSMVYKPLYGKPEMTEAQTQQFMKEHTHENSIILNEQQKAYLKR